MRKNRVSCGDPIYWTLDNLQQVLSELSTGNIPGDTLILLDGCDCCSNQDEGGVFVRENLESGKDKVIILRKRAGFEDGEKSYA